MEYTSIDPGLIEYTYTYEIVPEQVLSDIGNIIMFGSTAAVFMLSGGTVLKPVPVY